mmetsp:Transcript_28414/g.90923  ORF Transcript_28414/g.90923 Transcript_28414/m.90923 type:complete len:109 (-) Transcript_28414:120-446(-)
MSWCQTKPFVTMRAAGAAVAVIIGAGGMFYSFSPAAAKEWGPIDDAINESRRQQDANARREQNLALQAMIAETRGKTTSEKLETAFDAAMRTHEIGFPKSASRREGSD